MAAWIIAILRIVISSVGIFFAFYHHFSDPPGSTDAIDLVVLLVTVPLGLLGFTGHVLMHASDARRLTGQQIDPLFQYEVGFANLAFGLVALLVALGNWPVAAKIAVTLAFGLYLTLAGILHLWRALHGQGAHPGQVVLRVVSTLVVGGMMLFFALSAASGARLPPF
jgi:hypothetical protein